MGKKSKDSVPTFDDTEEITPSFDDTEAIDEPQKKNSELESGSESVSTSTEGVSAYAPPSISKIKNKNADSVALANSDVLKEHMAKDLYGASDTYKKVYLNTLKKKGYDGKQLDAFASSIPMTPEQMDKFTKDYEEKSGLKYVGEMPTGTDFTDEMVSDATKSLIEGKDQMGSAIKKTAKNLLLESQGTPTTVGQAADNNLNFVSGALKAGFGLASAATPELAVFNAGIKAIEKTPESIKSKVVDALAPEQLTEGVDEAQKAQVFDKTISFPFAAATSIAEAAGYKMEDHPGSWMNAGLEILNFALIPLAHKAAGYKGSIKNTEDLNVLYDKIAKEEATPEEIQDYKEFSDALKVIPMEEVKAEAEKVSEELPVKDDADHVKVAELEEKIDSPEIQALPEDSPIKQGLIAERQAALENVVNKNKEEINSSIQEAKAQARFDDLHEQIAKAEEIKANSIPAVQTVIQKTIDNLKQEQDALQEQSTSGVLQYSQEGVGETGSERGRVEPVVEGNEVAPETEIQKPQEEIIAETETPVTEAQKEVAVETSVLTEPPPDTPIHTNEITPDGPKKEKGVLGSLAKRSELTDPVKKAIEDKQLEYEQYSNKDALSVADGIVGHFKETDPVGWVDKAVDYASVKQKGVPLSINAMVLGRVIAHFGELSKKATEVKDKEAYGEMAADVADKMDDLARDFGRFNSAINEVYHMDEFAVRARIKKKIDNLNQARLDEKRKDSKSNREKVDQAYAELEKLKSEIEARIEKGVNEGMDQVMEQLPKERKSYAKKVVAALDQAEKDILSGKIAFSSVIPPPVAVALIRSVKLLVKGGMLVTEAIEKAIDEFKGKYSDLDFDAAQPKIVDYFEGLGISDKAEPKTSKDQVSSIEKLVKKVQGEFKKPKAPKEKAENAAEGDLTAGVKLPADYAKDVAKIDKEREALNSRIAKEADREAAKALREEEKALAEEQKKIQKGLDELERINKSRQKLAEQIERGAEKEAERNVKGVQKQLDAVEQRRIKAEQEKLDKEQAIIEEGLKALDGTRTREAELKIFNKIFPKKRMESAKKRQALHEKIIDAYNAGALDRAEFEKLFYDKFGLVNADVGVIKEKLDYFAERIHNAADGGLKEREYTNMLNFLEDHQKQNLAEWFTTPFYANILSGYETHLNNTQFNMMSGIAQTALLAEKNPKNAKFLAMKMLSNFPAALTQGANVLMNGIKYGEPAAAESLAERRADKGPGISHYYKLPGRMLKAADAIFNTPIKRMKKAELLLTLAETYNKTLPKAEQKSRTEIQADINDIMFQTTERKAQALEQAKADIIKLEGPDVDFTDKKITRDLKLRQFEIMENTRPEDKYLQYGIDYNAVNEQAQDFANRSLLQGKPVGSMGALSTMLESIAQGLPLSKFALTTFINVPLNLANMMIDKSPLAFARMAAYEAKGRRGLFTTEEYSKRNNIKTDLTPDQRKEAYIRAANYTAALVGLAALTGIEYTDDKGKKRKVLEVTTDGTGDFQKNKELQMATGGKFEEYTADLMGLRFSYKYNSILAPLLTPIGAVQDYEKYRDKTPESEKSMTSKVAYGAYSYLSFVGNQANLQGFRDIFGTQRGKTIDEDNWSDVIKDWFAKLGSKAVRNMLVPNFALQANRDYKGLAEQAEKKPIQWYDYMIKDVPLVESVMANRFDHLGRDVKSQFKLPIVAVPDKLNIKTEDPYYKMMLDHNYYPAFVAEKTVYDGDKEIDLTVDQMDKMNKLRGEYVLKKLQSKEVVDKGKTYMQLLKDLNPEDFKEEMNKLYKDGELSAKSKIMGIDVEKELKVKRKEDRREASLTGKKKLVKLFQRFRDKDTK